jgi:cell shape-determining protein MreC
MTMTSVIPKYPGKTCHSATFLTLKKHTWTDLGMNQGLRGDKPAVNNQHRGLVIQKNCS